MGILYYEDAGKGSGMVVITPSAQGTGVIHLKDETTNTVRSIPFKVVGAGEGIDIYKDNGIFTFYNKDKSVYDDTAASGTQNWDFTENTVVWGTGSAPELLIQGIADLTGWNLTLAEPMISRASSKKSRTAKRTM